MKSLAAYFILTALISLVLSQPNGFNVDKSKHWFESTFGWLAKYKSLESARQTKEFPCPDAAAILPCNCYYGPSIDIFCNNVTAEDLSRVFQQEFPVKEINQLSIRDSPLLSVLNFDLNGVTIKDLDVFNVPLAEISPEFLANSSGTLKSIILQYTELTTEGFPFETLHNYEVLQVMAIDYANLESIPKIVSQSLEGLEIHFTNVSAITPGIYPI